MSKKNVWIDIMKSFSLISQLGMIVIVCIFGCGFLGKFIDSKMNTAPIFTLIFILMGIGSAFTSIYKIMKPFMEKRK